MEEKFIEFKCGVCGKPVKTEWSPKGLLEGSYLLMGEVFFHKGECADKYLQSFEDHV